MATIMSAGTSLAIRKYRAERVFWSRWKAFIHRTIMWCMIVRRTTSSAFAWNHGIIHTLRIYAVSRPKIQVER